MHNQWCWQWIVSIVCHHHPCRRRFFRLPPPRKVCFRFHLSSFFFFFFFLPYHLFLLRLENRTKPISTPYDGRCWWDSNLRTAACKSPALLLCYGRLVACLSVNRTTQDISKLNLKFGRSKGWHTDRRTNITWQNRDENGMFWRR